MGQESEAAAVEPPKKKPRKKKPHPLGGLLILGLIVAAVIGVGLLLGNRDDAAKTPCERYARTVARALDNCHSGLNRNHDHHIAICKKRINPTRACLDKIQSLTCDELERRGGAAATDECFKD